MTKPRLTLYIIVIAALLAGARNLPLAAGNSADRAAAPAPNDAVDSQAFLQSHMTPAGPPASASPPPLTNFSRK